MSKLPALGLSRQGKDAVIPTWRLCYLGSASVLCVAISEILTGAGAACCPALTPAQALGSVMDPNGEDLLTCVDTLCRDQTALCTAQKTSGARAWMCPAYAACLWKAR